MAVTTGHARDLADAIGGSIVRAKSYDRIVFGKRTLAYANHRRDGVQLDFATAAVERAPARLRKGLDVKGPRARIRVNGKNVAAARSLLEWLASEERS